MKEYLDRSLFANPLTRYLRWLGGKVRYQLKYWGDHLRISYGTLVRNSTFGKYNWLGNDNLLENVQLGDHSYIAGKCLIRNCSIGRYCAIAQNVLISPGTHPTSGFVSIHPVTYSKPAFPAKVYLQENHFDPEESVTIGNDVWIGANVLVLGGVHIGDGAVIAANSVVNKDVADYEIVGGVPAKVIRKRFTDDQITYLKALQWWDKDEEWLKENISKFCSIEELMKS